MDAKFFYAAEPADSSKKAIFKRNFRSFVRASRSVARGHPFCMSDAEGKRTSKEEMSSVSCTSQPCSPEAGDLT